MKRTIALGAAWTASAAAAVGLGFLAVSLVDASASPGTTPAAATSSPSGSSAGPSSGSAPSSAPGATGQFDTAGGTVFADCTTGSPLLAGVPAAGWYVDDSNDPGELEFTTGDQDVEVHVTCVGGAPVFALDDSSHSGSHSSSSSSRSSTSGSDDSGRDDSSGRDGGGHGSDDGAGDDSSGRHGGGHGSDD